jgi:peptidyl-tRNA hydrolase, PTH1 family
MKYLIVGLGNIGPEYELTRHNIGFLVLDRLAEQFKVDFSLERHAFKTEIKHKGRSLHLIKPTTYMNLSGKAVAYWLNELKIPKENLLVIVDDLALPFGKDYPRLRFGIGDDFGKGQQVDFVLSNFSSAELKELPLTMDRANEMVLSFCTAGIANTMSQFNM